MVKGLEPANVRMFFKEKWLVDNEMTMVISIMNLFKHLHTISQISEEVKSTIKDICETWQVCTEWQNFTEFDAGNEQLKNELMYTFVGGGASLY